MSLRIRKTILLAWLSLLMSGASRAAAADPVVATYDFSQGSQGWLGDIADYHTPLSAYQPFTGPLGVPQELGAGIAFFTRATSSSDGPFVFLKRRMSQSDGLLPNYMYQVQVTVHLASKSPAGCAEPPDAPGDSVDLYLGASTREPRAFTMNGFEYELNVPLGTSGGDTANGMFCDQAGALGFPFVPIERNVVHTNLISSGDNGSFWVYVGAYLNGGGRTDLYYQQITATLTPLTLAPIQPLARYITVYPTPNAGMPSAIRVKLVSLHHPNPPYFGPPGPSFAAFEGQYRWLGAPFDCQDSVTLGTEFKCAVLQCTPMYVDWEAVLGPYVLYVTGSEIVPSSTFLVQMIDEGQDVQNEANYTTSVQVKTARWGDVAEAFQQPSPAPLSQPDVFDVVAAVDRLKDLSNAMIKPRGQLQPAAVDPANAFTVVEVAMAVDALKGKPYPFTQMQTCP